MRPLAQALSALELALSVELSAAPLEDDPPQGEAKRLRADARRNRDKLIEIAATLFAERGVDASLEEVARRAGVGIGTLYRHFPTREDLVEVLYRREIEALCIAAEDYSREHPADVALEQWMQRFVGYIAAKRGMAASLKILFGRGTNTLAEAYGLIPVCLKRLVAAATAEGSIRTDVDATDILQALSGIYSAPDTPEWQERSGRLVRLLMDGLRAGAKGKE